MTSRDNTEPTEPRMAEGDAIHLKSVEEQIDKLSQPVILIDDGATMYDTIGIAKERKQAILALLSAERRAGAVEELEKFYAMWPYNQEIMERLAELRREG